jgi:hypothetical protein
MPVLNRIAKVITKPLPRMVSPTAHAVVDYVTVGSFLVSAGFFWRRNKRAALAALICGSADLILSLLTDYPGGVKRVISFPVHREIDLGLAAMTATIPEFLAFKDDSERKFFLAQGALITAANELTRFPETVHRTQKPLRRLSAA